MSPPPAELHKVRPGEPLRIPARAYNAFVDAAQQARRIETGMSAADVGTGINEQLVLVRNESGDDLPRFGVLGINGPIVSPGDGGNADEFKRRTAIVGAAITSTDEYVGRFVVAREPIPVGRIGVAFIRGVTPAVVEVGDEEHTHADTFPDSQYLTSGFTGAARILWKEEGTGQKLAVVEIGPGGRDRFPARLLGAVPIDGRSFGWLYRWEEVRLNADAGTANFAQYVAVPEGTGLRSAGSADKLAFNRYEAHLSVLYPQSGGGGGVEGFVNVGACVVPGVLEKCPPAKAIVPILRPVPEGVVVELRAERTLHGDTRFVFDAMTPVEFEEMAVPGGQYE